MRPLGMALSRSTAILRTSKMSINELRGSSITCVPESGMRSSSNRGGETSHVDGNVYPHQ